jgi:hypothetical protein
MKVRKTPTVILTLGYTLMLSAAGHAQTFPVLSDFTSSSDGWTKSHNGTSARWASSGGNPGGYVEYLNISPVAPAPTYIRAPARFLGVWSPLDGRGHLRYDHGVFEQTTVQGTFPHAVIISGPGGSATWTGAEPGAPSSGWTNIIVPIRGEVWQVTSGSWSSILTNVTTLDIRYELYRTSGGVDREGVDNVQLDFDRPQLSIRCSQVELCWSSVSNRVYQVQYRSTLTTNLWVDFGSALTASSPTTCVTDAVLPGSPQRFYQVLQLP